MFFRSSLVPSRGIDGTANKMHHTLEQVSREELTRMYEALKLEHWMLKETLEKRDRMSAEPRSAWNEQGAFRAKYEELKRSHDELKLEHWMLKQTLVLNFKHKVPEQAEAPPPQDVLASNSESLDERPQCQFDVMENALASVHETLRGELAGLIQEHSSCQLRIKDENETLRSECATLKKDLWAQQQENRAMLLQLEELQRREEANTKVLALAKSCESEGQPISQTYAMLIRENDTLKQAHAALDFADETVRKIRRSTSPSMYSSKLPSNIGSPRSPPDSRRVMRPSSVQVSRCSTSNKDESGANDAVTLQA